MRTIRVSRDKLLDVIVDQISDTYVEPALGVFLDEDEDYIEKDLQALEADPLAWAREMFPNYTKGEFSKWQVQFWMWCFAIVLGVASKHFGAFWPRGHAKSSTAAMAVIYLMATKRRKYVLYVAATQVQAEKHMNAMIQMLESSRIDRYYPHLGNRQETKFRIRRNWNAKRVVTAGGTVIDAVGLDQAIRGLRYEELRPDLIVLDDIDKRHESPQMTRKKREILTDSILPAGSKDVAVVFAQNVIREGSIAHSVASGSADFLVDLERSGPYPGLRGCKIVPAKGKAGDRRRLYEIVEGAPTWPWFDLEACQHLLDTIGLDAFLREVQQDFRRRSRGRIWADLYDERVHVITWSEFASVYPRAAVYNAKGELVRYRIPLDWKLDCTQDWGTNDDHPCVTLYGARPSELDPHNDIRFLWKEVMFPQPYEDVPELDEVNPEDFEKVTINRVGAYLWRLEQNDRIHARVNPRVMSHEAKSARDGYMRDLPVYLHDPKARLAFAAFNTQKQSDTGIDQIRNLLDPIPEENPFRVYPVGHPREGTPLWGRPRLVMIVPDEEGELVYDPDHYDECFVMPPKTHDGFSRLRYEIPIYQYDETLSGKLKRVPLAEDNDACDALRMKGSYWGPSVGKDTTEAKVKRQIETDERYKHLSDEAIAARPDESAKVAALMTREMIEAKLTAQIEKQSRNGQVVEHRLVTRARNLRDQKVRDEEDDHRW